MLRLLGPDGYLTSPQWVPHTRCVLSDAARAGISASAFPRPSSHHQTTTDAAEGDDAAEAAAAATPLDSAGAHDTSTAHDVFFSLVHRGDAPFAGATLSVPCGHHGAPRTRFFDVFAGAELQPTAIAADGSAAVLSLSLEPGGFGGVLVTSSPPSAALLAHLALVSRSGDAQRLLSSFDATWQPLPQRLTTNLRTSSRAVEHDWVEGMVRIPETSSFRFTTRGLIIEPEDSVTGMVNALDVQFPWEATPSRRHSQALRVRSFLIDK